MGFESFDPKIKLVLNSLIVFFKKKIDPILLKKNDSFLKKIGGITVEKKLI